MQDKLLTYAIIASIAIHLATLSILGGTSAAKPIEVEQLKIVKVDLIKEPDQSVVEQEKQPEEPKPKVEQSPPESPYVPPPSKMVTDRKPPKPTPEQRQQWNKEQAQPRPTNTRPTGHNQTTRTVTAQIPGNPGGPLGGITAPNGEDLGVVREGTTPVGHVPGSDWGKGSGSGSGKGKGSAEPDPDAVDGPGLTTSPPPPQPPRPPSPPQPPPVVMKSVKVCSVSGLLPGAHCERKETKSFKTGSEPKRQCGMCKAPEPKHVSTLADVAEPVLVKDYEPNIPDIDEPGDYTVKLEYTVGTDGNVSNVKVVSSCGIKAIDKAVVDAAKKIRYRPAVQNGQPRSVNIKRTYKIRI